MVTWNHQSQSTHDVEGPAAGLLIPAGVGRLLQGVQHPPRVGVAADNLAHEHVLLILLVVGYAGVDVDLSDGDVEVPAADHLRERENQGQLQ